KAWGKTPRIKGNGLPYVIITEKLDGTNACVVIKDGNLMGCQSRNRIITPDSDNYGFATWADTVDWSGMPDGYHYGEWYGEGIQKNPNCIEGKRFALFKVEWYTGLLLPEGVELVPVLYSGQLNETVIQETFCRLKEDKPHAEGII